MTERRRPPRRGRGKRPTNPTTTETADNPYLDDAEGSAPAESGVEQRTVETEAPPAPRVDRRPPPEAERPADPPPPSTDQGDGSPSRSNGAPPSSNAPTNGSESGRI